MGSGSSAVGPGLGLGEPVQRTDRCGSGSVMPAPGREPPALPEQGGRRRRRCGYERLKYSFEDTVASTSFSSVVPDWSLFTQ